VKQKTWPTNVAILGTWWIFGQTIVNSIFEQSTGFWTKIWHWVKMCFAGLNFVPAKYCGCHANVEGIFWRKVKCYCCDEVSELNSCWNLNKCTLFVNLRLYRLSYAGNKPWLRNSQFSTAVDIFLDIFRIMQSWGSVAVTLARPLHVSKVGQSKKGKTKQAPLISDFHPHGSKSSLWLIRLARS